MTEKQLREERISKRRAQSARPAGAKAVKVAVSRTPQRVSAGPKGGDVGALFRIARRYKRAAESAQDAAASLVYLSPDKGGFSCRQGRR